MAAVKKENFTKVASACLTTTTFWVLVVASESGTIITSGETGWEIWAGLLYIEELRGGEGEDTHGNFHHLRDLVKMKLSSLLSVCALLLPAGSLVAAVNDGTVIHFVEGRPVVQHMPELRNRGLSDYSESKCCCSLA